MSSLLWFYSCSMLFTTKHAAQRILVPLSSSLKESKPCDRLSRRWIWSGQARPIDDEEIQSMICGGRCLSCGNCVTETLSPCRWESHSLVAVVSMWHVFSWGPDAKLPDLPQRCQLDIFASCWGVVLRTLSLISICSFF